MDVAVGCASRPVLWVILAVFWQNHFAAFQALVYKYLMEKRKADTSIMDYSLDAASLAVQVAEERLAASLPAGGHTAGTYILL